MHAWHILRSSVDRCSSPPPCVHAVPVPQPRALPAQEPDRHAARRQHPAARLRAAARAAALGVRALHLPERLPRHLFQLVGVLDDPDCPDAASIHPEHPPCARASAGQGIIPQVHACARAGHGRDHHALGCVQRPSTQQRAPGAASQARAPAREEETEAAVKGREILRVCMNVPVRECATSRSLALDAMPKRKSSQSRPRTSRARSYA